MVQQNLFDELETQKSAAVAPAPKRASQLSPGERAAWEDWRARVLPGFVAPYCRALAASRLHRACWWVDGLMMTSRSNASTAASAAIDETGETLAASGFALRPLRLDAQPPKNQEQTAAPESDTPPGNGRKGRKAAAQAQPPAQEAPASISRGELSERLNASPAIMLLNPFATPPLTAEELLPLCQRQAPTELLLPISIVQVERWATQSLSGTAPERARTRPAEAQPPALTALFRSDSWKAIWTGEGSSADKVARTLELLRGLLKPYFLYICLAPLDEAPTPRRFLLFASRQYSSLALMSDFLCAERARTANERETRALQGNWFARRREKARAAAWAALKEEIHTLGLARRARLWSDLKPGLVLGHFGQFSTADHDSALLELIQEGRVHCRWSPAASDDSADTPTAARIPGQQDFLEFTETRTRPVWRR